MEKYPTLLKIKDDKNKTLFEWAIETKNDKAIIVFRLANFISKQDKKSKQLKFAEKMWDDIKFSAFSDDQYEKDIKQIDILTENNLSGNKLRNIYEDLYHSGHFRTPAFYRLREQVVLSLQQGDINFIKNIYDEYPEVFTHYTSRCEHRRMQNLKVVCNS